MKVILVATYDWYMYNFKLPIAQGLREQGFYVVLVTPPGPYVERMQDKGYVWREWALDRHSMNPLKELRALVHLLQIYRQEAPDIVHHFTAKGMLYGTIAARLARVQHIINAVTGGVSALGNVVSDRKWVYQIVKKFVGTVFQYTLSGTEVIFQNPDDMEAFIGQKFVTRSRAHLIKGSGVDLEEFRGTNEREGLPTVILAGRLLWSKGVGEFVEASKHVRRRGKEIRFVLVGDTDKSNPKSVPGAQIEEWEEDGLVEWWGFREDMQAVFEQSHIVCSPSYYREGVPKVLIEAAACERPIVTTDMPGCREIVRNDKNGILVPPKNAEALADALIRLASDASLRRKMGRRGREIVKEEFSVERVVEQTMEVYDKLSVSESLTVRPVST